MAERPRLTQRLRTELKLGLEAKHGLTTGLVVKALASEEEARVEADASAQAVPPTPDGPTEQEVRADSDIASGVGANAEAFEFAPAHGLAPIVGDGRPLTAFDHAHPSNLPLPEGLPKAFRPPVTHRIRDDFSVEGVGKSSGRPAELQDLLVRAVALHLADHGIKLDAPRDWRLIPPIGSASNLKGLASRAAAREDNGPSSAALLKELAYATKNLPTQLKHFAIELPNGDIIKPDALIMAAGTAVPRSGTTLFAALCNATDRSQHMANGSAWCAEDWGAFEKSQKSAAKRLAEGAEPLTVPMRDLASDAKRQGKKPLRKASRRRPSKDDGVRQ